MDKEYVKVVVNDDQNFNITMDKKYLQMASILNTLDIKGMNKADEMPMLSIPFLDWINSYDFSNHTMIEFGSGNSTNYFADRFKSVLSYETNQGWFDKVSKDAKENVECKLISPEDVMEGNYLNFEGDNTVILIDMNLDRRIAAEALFKNNKPDIVVLDNSEWAPKTCKFIQEQGYMQIPFWGIRFEEYYDKCTSIFLKLGYRLPNTKYQYFTEGAYILNSEE